MAGQVYENIWRIPFDQCSGGIIIHSVQVRPLAGQLSQGGACGVLTVVAMIKKRLNTRGVEICKKRLEKEGNRVVSQIRRNKADAQLFIGFRRDEENLKFVLGVDACEFLVRFENALAILPWQVVEQHVAGAQHAGVLGLHPKNRAVEIQRFLRFVKPLQAQRAGARSGNKEGVELQRLVEAIHAFGNFAALLD